MKSRRPILAAVVVLIVFPAVLALAAAVSNRTRNRNNGSIVSSGVKREYLLYVPTTYDRRRPAPLVISLHGAGGWPVQQRNLSGWNALAEREGFLVVYPAGRQGTGPRVWSVEQGEGLTRDVRFISDLIGTLERSYNIDRRRIYANGISNGGGMAFVLSCTMSDQIAAIGMVAAAQTLPWNWCTDHRAVPMISFHGTADPMIPYAGGSTWIAPARFPAAAAWAARWAARNHCGSSAIEAAIKADVTRSEYTNCADDASVELFTIRGGGHTWPGGEPMPEWFVGPTSRSIDATRTMWDFFRAHPLRSAPP